MSTAAADFPPLPPASAADVARSRLALIELAARYRIGELRFASPGRLVGRIDEPREALETIELELAASELLGAEVDLFSDRVLTKPHVSADLLAAAPV